MLFDIGASTTNQPGSSDIQFKVYPNPANNSFLVDYYLSENINKSTIEIVDLTGKKLKSIILYNMQNQLVIETKGMKTGIYYLYLTNDDAVVKQSEITIVN